MHRIFFLFGLFLPCQLFGQTLYITGIVLAGTEVSATAEITLTQKDKVYKITPTSEGTFEFKDIPRADFVLAVKQAGFNDYTRSYTPKQWDDEPATIITLVDQQTRSRAIDYADYDNCLAQYAGSQDKKSVIKRLQKTIDKNFTPKDEEYFYGTMVVGGYYYSTGMVKEALIAYTKCIDAYEKNYPFERRGALAMVGSELAESLYLTIGGMYISLRLYESGLEFLEAKKSRFMSNPYYIVPATYYHFKCMANTYLKNYDEAIANANEIKKIADRKEPLTEAQDSQLATPEMLSSMNEAERKSMQEQQTQMDSLIAKRNRATEEQARLSMQSFYHSDMAAAYGPLYNYKELVVHYKAMDEINKKFKTISGQINSTYNDYSSSETPEYKKYAAKLARFQALPIGPSSALIYALCKNNQSDEAKKYITDLLDQALWEFYNGQYAQTEQHLNDYFTLLQEFDNDPDVGFGVKQFRDGRLAYYTRALVLQGKIDLALPFIKNSLKEDEASLQKGFAYFTEGEKKDLLRSYDKSLAYYYSVLLSPQNDPSKRLELLDKVLQTKGLVLEYTLHQNQLRNKLSDDESVQQLQQLKLAREKQSSFNELSRKTPQPYWKDSLIQNGNKISSLERAINMKSGTQKLFNQIVWQDIQKKLRSGEVYVDIVRIERENFKMDPIIVQYWAFVIKSGNELPSCFLLGEGKAFERGGLKNYQNRIRTKDEDPDSYWLFWAKLDSAAGSAKKMFFVSDGIYNLINPATLINPANKKYVLETSEINRLASGRDLIGTAQSNLPVTSFTLLGNPDFKMQRKHGTPNPKGEVLLEEVVVNRSGFSDLPGTAKELDLIEGKALHYGKTAKTFERDEATEANIKHTPPGSVVHFATHGTFDKIQDATDSYMKSKLVLAGAADSEPFTLEDYENFEDGLLSAYEVMQMDFSNSQLVVLSACETGIGDVESGEGVWGLQRAFQVAGARSVMGSLWTIDDEPTVYFMDRFYETYLKGASTQVAYQSAMIEARKKYPHPFYWGAFILLAR